MDTGTRPDTGPARRSRRAILRGSAAAPAALLAACAAPGGGGPAGGPPGGAGGAVPPGTTVRLYVGLTPQLTAPYVEALRPFTERTGIKVELEPAVGSGPYEVALLTQVAAGAAPDVSNCFGDPLYFFVDNNAAEDLTQRIAKDVPKAEAEDWLPSQLASFQRGGKQYALPKYCGTSALYGNTELYKQAGVPFPDARTAWPQFRDRLAALTKTEGGQTLPFGLTANSYAHLGYVLAPLVWAWGGEVTDPKDDTKCLLDQPAALDALQFWQDLRWKQHVVPRPDEAAAQGAGSPFAKGYGANERNGSWLITTYQAENPALAWDAFPHPLGPAGARTTFHTTDGYVMLKNTSSKAPEAAWQLLRYVSGLDWGRMLIRERQRQPARRSLAPEWVQTTKDVAPAARGANLEVFVQAFEYARPQHSFANNPKAYEVLDPVLQAVYERNEVPASQAFKEAAPKVTQLLQSLKR